MNTYGKYLLLEQLGEGGMAEVFLAKAVGAMNVSRYVALKRVLSHLSRDAELRELFIDEVRLAVQLSHPSIISVYDFGVEEESLFLTMELIQGQDLRQLTRRPDSTPIPLECALYVVAQVARALDYAHQLADAEGNPLRIVHRDVTPSNILLSYRGDVKLADFGIARATSRLRGDRTRTGELKGTLRYMSPEQARGQKLDCRSDLFSLTTILLELVISNPVFKAESELETLNLVQSGRPRERDQYRDAIPDDVADIIDLGMALDPLARPSGTDLADMLELALRQRAPTFGPTRIADLMQRRFAAERAAWLERLRQHEIGAAATLPATTSLSTRGDGDPNPTIAPKANRSSESSSPKAGELVAAPARERPLRRNAITAAVAVAATTLTALVVAPRLQPRSPQSSPPRAVPAAPVATAAPPVVGPQPAIVESASKTSYGTLNLQSTPWATVNLDGKIIGQTPIVHFKVKAGTHKITFTNPGAPPKTIHVHVIANHESTEIADLAQ